jgi:hypothetical protein
VSYPAEFKQVVAELGAQDFTSITYVDPPKVAKVKTTRQDTEFCLHPVYGERHKYTTLATNTQKWIYVRMTEGSWPAKYDRSSLGDLQEYSEETEDFRICGVAERAAKMIEGDPNFISIEEYLKNFKVDKELIAAAKNTASKNTQVMSLMAAWKDIDDTFLVEMIDEYKALGKSKVSKVPALIANKIGDLKEIKEFKENDLKLTALLRTEYPLVKDCEYSNNKKELVFYINAKFAAAKKAKKSS